MKARINNAEIVKALSNARLSSYRKTGANNAQVLIEYHKNVRLSMALYPILQQFEIVLRNQLEQILIADYGTQWYSSTAFITLLDSWMVKKLNETKNTLTGKGKTINSGAVVAESTFGFWTALLGKNYNSIIWFKHDKSIFPFTAIRDIKTIRADLKNIRDLRNRIAHHEPIWHDSDLLLKYQSIMQLLGWMNPHVTLWLHRTKLDHFTIVHKAVYHPTPRKPRVKK